MDFLALIPGVFAVYVAFACSPRRAFVSIYLPVLILFPEYYRCVLQGLPDPTFSQAAILPIAAALLLRDGFRRWRFTFKDFLVMGFAFIVGYSEYHNAGYKEAQNLMFDVVAWVILPYVLGKALIEPRHRVEVARRLVILMSLVVLVSLYESRMGVTPFRLLLDRFFPWQGLGWVTTFRWGFVRIAGPYGHAILAGTVLTVGLSLHLWLERSGLWEKGPGWSFRLPQFRGRLLTVCLVGGLIMTLSRAPWFGAVVAGLITWAGCARNRRRVLLRLTALAAVGVIVFLGVWSYASVGREGAMSRTQETAAYRKELVEQYVDVAIQNSLLGWGRNSWPKLAGMNSIDNYYLLLALMHGVVALGFLLWILGDTTIRLLRMALAEVETCRGSQSFGFTLLGIHVAIGIAIATVYLGNQLVPLFFLLTGWAEGYLITEGSPGDSRVPSAAKAVYVPFRRILT